MNFTPAPKVWFALDITAGPEAAEAIEFALGSLDTLGTEINHLRKKQSGTVTVTGYFDQLPEEESVQDEIHYSLRVHDLTEAAVLTIERREIENTDWLVEWKKHWKPTETDGFIVAPPWETVADTPKIVIFIEPNMAFGTGTHETTRLCLDAITDHYRAGESFLDVGTGTGILSIAAAKMCETDACNIYACDTDFDSITIARDNAALNQVGTSITFDVGTVSERTDLFDFVCANLTLDVIRPNLQLLTSKTRRMLVLSGILREQEPTIVKALSDLGIGILEVRRSGDWIAVIVPKKLG